uniref:Peptidase S1 domain-containing protein n=1 Tax=Anopheles atroparvus TaxID=41427 RepID=A0AAG5DTV7_ANOAO
MCHTTTNPTALAAIAVTIAIAIGLPPHGALAAVDPVPGNGTEGGPRIIGGFEAPAESTRHQISLRVKCIDYFMFGRGHICGGSLISSKHVLTAAHCLVDEYGRTQPADFFVVVGGNTERLVQTANTFTSQVEKVIAHAHYDAELFANDIGLLHLTTTVPANHPTLQPIALVEQSPPAGTICQVTGWGSTVSGVQVPTEKLMAVNITIIDTAICNSTDSYSGELMAGMICAGQLEGGKDSCQGDSGGPLVCTGLLAGVVSFGYECGKANFPGVYADVAYYREWIRVNSGARHSVGGTLLSALLLLALVHFHANLK